MNEDTWGMIVSLLLSLCKPSLEMSTPSIRIRPLAGSISLLHEVDITLFHRRCSIGVVYYTYYRKCIKLKVKECLPEES